MFIGDSETRDPQGALDLTPRSGFFREDEVRDVGDFRNRGKAAQVPLIIDDDMAVGSEVRVAGDAVDASAAGEVRKAGDIEDLKARWRCDGGVGNHPDVPRN